MTNITKKVNSWTRCCMALAIVLAFSSGLAKADTLSDIKAAGTVKFGVKADVKPWAYVDSQGNPIGFEIDMAKKLAEQMGVKTEFITVTSSNRIQYLEQGKIDIVLATMSDTPKRRKVVHMVEPHYFADATNVMSKPAAGINGWQDIKDQALCGVNGAFYNKWAAKKYGSEVKAFKGPPEAIAALKQGQCVGFLYSDQILRITKDENSDLSDYVISLKPVNPDYWGMAVRKDSDSDTLAEAISTGITEMHESGQLLDLAKPYGLGGNPFLKSKTTD